MVVVSGGSCCVCVGIKLSSNKSCNSIDFFNIIIIIFGFIAIFIVICIFIRCAQAINGAMNDMAVLMDAQGRKVRHVRGFDIYITSTVYIMYIIYEGSIYISLGLELYVELYGRARIHGNPNLHPTP